MPPMSSREQGLCHSGVWGSWLTSPCPGGSNHEPAARTAVNSHKRSGRPGPQAGFAHAPLGRLEQRPGLGANALQDRGTPGVGTHALSGRAGSERREVLSMGRARRRVQPLNGIARIRKRLPMGFHQCLVDLLQVHHKDILALSSSKSSARDGREPEVASGFPDHLVRETPLVVVPGHDLDQGAVHHPGQVQVDHARAGVADDVG
jgi:hypothetical protein